MNGPAESFETLSKGFRLREVWHLGASDVKDLVMKRSG
jgi:hypothetical protein